MYRIVIVDDFYIEREIAKSAINDAGLPLTIAGEYQSAKEALENLEEDSPDIVLVDVEMPGMSGIEFVGLAKAKLPSIRPIFFSYHNKFEYVKKAMDLNAYGYVLKPIDEEEIISVISKVIEEIQNDEKHKKTDSDYRILLNESKPLLIRTFKLDFFFGRLGSDAQKISERAAYLDLDIGNGPYVLCYLKLDSLLNEEDNAIETAELTALKATSLIEETPSYSGTLTFSRIGEVEWVFLLSSEKPNVISDMMDYITIVMDKLKHINIISVASISCTFENLTKVYRTLKQTEQLIGFRLSSENGHIVLQDEIGASDPLDEEYESLVKKAISSCVAGMPEATTQAVKNLTNTWTPGIHHQLIRNTCYRILAELQQHLTEYNMNFSEIFGNDKLLWEKLSKIDTVKNVNMWIENIMVVICRSIEAKKKGSSGQLIVDEIRSYISQNYSKELTVKDIAVHFCYNANYLNNLFKSILGETILDYITRYRIEEAKRLLKTSQMRIPDICNSVGYSQEAYFKALFRRYTGFTPKEFRKLSGGSRHEEADSVL